MSVILLRPPIGNAISVTVVGNGLSSLEAEREVHTLRAGSAERGRLQFNLLRLRLVAHVDGVESVSIGVVSGGAERSAGKSGTAEFHVGTNGAARVAVEQIY